MDAIPKNLIEVNVTWVWARVTGLGLAYFPRYLTFSVSDSDFVIGNSIFQNIVLQSSAGL